MRSIHGAAMLAVVFTTSTRPSLAAPSGDGEDHAEHDDALTVEVDADMFEGTAHRAWVRERGQVVVGRHEDLGRGDRIVIEIGGMALGYALSVRGIRAGEEEPEWIGDAACDCTTDELLLEVDMRVEQAAEALEKAEAAAQRKRASERAEHERVVELTKRPYRPDRLGIAGAVGTGIGVGGLVFGISLAVRDPGGLPSYLTVRPPLHSMGYALIGTGFGVLTAGVGLLVADVVRCRTDRVKCGSRGKKSARGDRARGLTWR